MPSHMSVVIVQDSFVILFIVAVGFWFAVLSDEVTSQLGLAGSSKQIIILVEMTT